MKKFFVSVAGCFGGYTGVGFITLACMLLGVIAERESAAAGTEAPTIFILDLSGSMNAIEMQALPREVRMGEAQPSPKRFEVAVRELKQKIENYQSSSRGFGLIAFGFRTGGCDDVETVTRVSESSYSQTLGFLNGVKPHGATPLSFALEQARSLLQESPTGTGIEVFSDGMESCEGDPVKVAATLHQQFPFSAVNIHLVGSVSARERAALEKVAKAGGGGISGSVSASGPGSPSPSMYQSPVTRRGRSSPQGALSLMKNLGVKEPVAGIDFPIMDPDSLPKSVEFSARESVPPQVSLKADEKSQLTAPGGQQQEEKPEVSSPDLKQRAQVPLPQASPEPGQENVPLRRNFLMNLF